MGSELTIFRTEHFENGEVANPFPRLLADYCNKILAERLVKYYASKTGLDDTEWYIDRQQNEIDTHIIYGLEPQPIVKETVKKEITREDLAKAFDKHTMFGEMGNTFKEICKELGL